jgi:hypothetical protein
MMRANGRSFSDKYDILHFMSIPDGAVNFQFENDKVVHIDGMTDDMGQFIWTLASSFACSDLPDSHYARCNK